MKKIYLTFLILIIFFCGCSVNGTADLKESTLFSYEKPNMIDSLTKEEQEKIIKALELSIPDGIELSVRFITFFEYNNDTHPSYYRIELDGIDDYEAFATANKEQMESERFVIDGYAQNAYNAGGKQYYLSVMVYTSDLDGGRENSEDKAKYFEKIKEIYAEIRRNRKDTK